MKKLRYHHARYLVIHALIVLNTWAASAINISNDDIAPAHFGPHALPIPDMLDGTVAGELRLELSADYYHSFRGDKTIAPFAKINVPLYPTWVNLTVWMPIMEFYQNSDNSTLRPESNPNGKRGKEAGDVYVTTDMQVLKQTRKRPDITLRVGLKTASGGSYKDARFTDSPGYWFDATVAKSITFNHPFWHELRFAGSAGFLCWQVGDALQNDAYMYGLQAKLRTEYFSTSVTWGGYTGWIRNGDAPMSLKAEVRGNIKKWEPFVGYQYGMRDFPYHQVRVGVAYSVDVAGWIQKKRESNKR